MGQRSERRGGVRAVGCLGLLLGTVALGAPTTPPSLSTSKVVDLSHPFDEKTLYWPTSPSSFELKKLSFGETPGGLVLRRELAVHARARRDAPRCADPLRQGREDDRSDPAPTADRAGGGDRRRREGRRRSRLPPVHGRRPQLGEAARDASPPGAIVLLRTGWGKRWPDRKQYLGDDTPGDASKLHFPSYGKESAEYLVGQRHVGALGLDTASIDVRSVQGLHRPPDRERGRSSRAGEPRQPRSGPRGGRVGHRAADEDWRRIRRSAPRGRARAHGQVITARARPRASARR